ncbi:lysophospholipid acyltransferase family protein [Pseudoglutamicibacter albus]|uniref:lysophospholipid acyltransferase family protein n=1 Tax=Pseudoglutamicibacter albus TaxID=98671 RepID=UPI000C793201|nr:lysophospholipid acyltransferase family protein [Pseudoglutamicibacter albus]PKY80545.1 1-acyl-sn-glycerol-3-phosphate acyltransferase [Pseudoglutamicibacter albus]WIK84542.1 lysophospholipid acyltransferase family protein [Pseudoglutamicibacter albus]
MASIDFFKPVVARAIKLVFRPTITGLENVPKEGPFIVASNHLSFFDSVIIQALMPRKVTFFAKAEYFTTPGFKGRLMKAFFTSVGSIPVQRGQQAASVAALDKLVEILEAGSGVGIYPEGTRSRDGRLYRGRTGVGWLALATGAPVVPVGLIGTDKLQPADSNRIRRHKFQLHVGQPLAFEHPGPKHPLPLRRKVTDQVVDAIAEITGQERVGEYNKAPTVE